MNVPGVGVVNDPLWEKAQEESERLAEALRKEVQVQSREIGVLRREMTITVPGKVIADHMEQQYSEIMHDALVPGFRKGRAPRRLVEKRFGSEVRESLTTMIVGRSFYAAAENEKLEPLGDPLFRVEDQGGVKLLDFDQALQHLKLPASGDFTYVCELEIKPTFELPELTGIPIKAVDVQIDDAMIDEQILRRRKLRGRFEPVAEPAAEDDQIVCDVVLSADGAEVKREENLTLGVRPTRLDGVALMDFGDKIKGARPGEKRSVECTIPEDYERADLRGKPGRFEFTVHEVKRLAPESLEDFVKGMGYDSEQELRDDIRRELESERDTLIARANKAQIEDYLLEKTPIELPEKFSARQTDRAVLRKVIDLQMRGVPMSDIEAKIDELRTQARAEVGRELKLLFVFDKVAETLGVDVTDEEVNTEIARIAAQYNQRFDRIRDDLQKRGLYPQLIEQIKHDKCVARLLEDAKLEPMEKKQPETKTKA